MDYFIIFILQIIGILFHVFEKVRIIDAQNREKGTREVFLIFFEYEWVTLSISILVLALNVITHYIIDTYANDLTTVRYYHIYVFVLAFILGYAGQRIVYKYLGKGTKFLIDKADTLSKKK